MISPKNACHLDIFLKSKKGRVKGASKIVWGQCAREIVGHLPHGKAFQSEVTPLTTLTTLLVTGLSTPLAEIGGVGLILCLLLSSVESTARWPT
jgi:hypothetical protein